MQLILQKCESADISWLDEFINFKELQVLSVIDSQQVVNNEPALFYDGHALSLNSSVDASSLPSYVDFNHPRVQYRLATSTRSEGLLKAIGLDKSSTQLSVLDATAGMGVDAYMLAASGCRVLMLEKSGVMAALLHNGLLRGRNSGEIKLNQELQNLSLNMVDSHDYLEFIKTGQEEAVDVITLDPMFPARKKSAKVKKAMAMMQELLPPNDDIESLLEKACSCAGKRVVLKRPGKISKQSDLKPDFQVPGRACHFQVFLTG